MKATQILTRALANVTILPASLAHTTGKRKYNYTFNLLFLTAKLQTPLLKDTSVSETVPYSSRNIFFKKQTF